MYQGSATVDTDEITSGQQGDYHCVLITSRTVFKKDYQIYSNPYKSVFGRETEDEQKQREIHNDKNTVWKFHPTKLNQFLISFLWKETEFHRNPTKINGYCIQTSGNKRLAAYCFCIFNICQHFKPQNYRRFPTSSTLLIHSIWSETVSVSWVKQFAYNSSK